MCDTLCSLGAEGTIFAKNSDRPVSEVQLIEAHRRRPPGGTLRTQYLELADAGAAALLIARPQWLWGAEHGVNEHGVAIGNEKVYTVVDPYAAAPSLIGMDLVRLGLERALSAEEALGVITALLAEHGQGGVADAAAREPYFSSFLIADRGSAWILETAGQTWAARAVDRRAAISNRVSLNTDWTRGSPDLAPGADFDQWRNPDAPTGHADRRLAASYAFLSNPAGDGSGRPALTPRQVVGHLRDHGTGPWGQPGGGGPAVAPPAAALPDGTGVTVCMHVRGYQATTSSIVALLPADPMTPLRAWVAAGSPCVSVYIPVFPPAGPPAQLSGPDLWHQLSALRQRVEVDGTLLAAIRAVLDPLESELWDEADEVAARRDRWSSFAVEAGRRVEQAIGMLVNDVAAGRPRPARQ